MLAVVCWLVHVRCSVTVLVVAQQEAINRQSCKEIKPCTFRNSHLIIVGCRIDKDVTLVAKSYDISTKHAPIVESLYGFILACLISFHNDGIGQAYTYTLRILVYNHYKLLVTRCGNTQFYGKHRARCNFQSCRKGCLCFKRTVNAIGEVFHTVSDVYPYDRLCSVSINAGICFVERNHFGTHQWVIEHSICIGCVSIVDVHHAEVCA